MKKQSSRILSIYTKYSGYETTYDKPSLEVHREAKIKANGNNSIQLLNFWDYF